MLIDKWLYFRHKLKVKSLLLTVPGLNNGVRRNCTAHLLHNWSIPLSPPSLLVSFTPIIHQNHIQAFPLQGRTDRASTHSEAAPGSGFKRPSHHKPGAFVKADWPIAIRGWRTIVPFFLFLWQPLSLADRWWESYSRNRRPFGFGWLTRTSKRGATEEGQQGLSRR